MTPSDPGPYDGRPIDHLRRKPSNRPSPVAATPGASLLDAGVDVFTVQKLAGHADAVTTARYDRRRETAQREAAQRLALPAA